MKPDEHLRAVAWAAWQDGLDYERTARTVAARLQAAGAPRWLWVAVVPLEQDRRAIQFTLREDADQPGVIGWVKTTQLIPDDSELYIACWLLAGVERWIDLTHGRSQEWASPTTEQQMLHSIRKR